MKESSWTVEVFTQQLKETLGLKPLARDRLCSKTFGSDYDNLKTVDVVKLCLENVHYDVTVTITAHVVPMISSRLNDQAVQFAERNHDHLKDIALSEFNPEENLVVDIFVRADQYWNIADGEVKRGERGPVAINTLSGPVENSPCSETRLVNLVATLVLRIDTGRDEMDVHEMELGAKLRTFWELESIGNKQEENSVLETFIFLNNNLNNMKRTSEGINGLLSRKKKTYMTINNLKQPHTNTTTNLKSRIPNI